MRKFISLSICLSLTLTITARSFAENADDIVVSDNLSQTIVEEVSVEITEEQNSEDLLVENNEETGNIEQDDKPEEEPDYFEREWDINEKNNIFEMIPVFLSEKSSLSYKFCSRKRIASASGFKFTEENKENDIERLTVFFVGLFDLIENDQKTDKVQFGENDYKGRLEFLNSEKTIYSTYEHNVVLTLKGNKISIGYIIYRYNEKIPVFTKTYYVNNPQKIVDYARQQKTENLCWIQGGAVRVIDRLYMGRLKLAESEEDTYVTHLQLVEKLEFDFKLDGTWFDTQIGDIASEGDTVHCTIEQWRQGTPYYLINFETQKGNFKSWLLMAGVRKFTDNKLVIYGSHRIDETGRLYGTGTLDEYERASHNYIINGKIVDGKFDSVTIGCSLFGTTDGQTYSEDYTLERPITLKCSNIKYEYYQSDEYKNGNVKIDLVRCFSYDKEAAWEAFQNEPVADNVEIDPEYMVSELKTYDEDGNVRLDVEMRYAAKMKLDEYKNPTGWCTKLGDDIEVTLVGMMQTLKGEPRMTYPMIRFKGSKGTIWFDSDTIMQGTDKDVIYSDMSEQISEDRMAYVSFQSLISFENKVRIRNSVSYDKLEMYMTFTDETRIELESIKLKLPGKNITIKVEDMNYIGGGEYGYESWL